MTSVQPEKSEKNEQRKKKDFENGVFGKVGRKEELSFGLFRRPNRRKCNASQTLRSCQHKPSSLNINAVFFLSGAKWNNQNSNLHPPPPPPPHPPLFSPVC
ncbi:hypothetical protein Q7C36_010933 [Tachysurus vachellii]|uniref:Uncharacterized protein n=1 Tax=Tachysurus vachellii TaxID=175792 RepID=A0AA88SUJ2_TACVA|nr:hypothetical protein Q7C36_010933 [Tachysurus vachellii]